MHYEQIIDVIAVHVKFKHMRSRHLHHGPSHQLGFVGLQDGLKMAPRIQKTERTTYAQNDKENDNENEKVC